MRCTTTLYFFRAWQGAITASALLLALAPRPISLSSLFFAFSTLFTLIISMLLSWLPIGIGHCAASQAPNPARRLARASSCSFELRASAFLLCRGYIHGGIPGIPEVSAGANSKREFEMLRSGLSSCCSHCASGISSCQKKRRIGALTSSRIVMRNSIPACSCWHTCVMCSSSRCRLYR